MKDSRKYRCNVCKWVYDPNEGDIKGGIPAGTTFDKLPATWVCPVCKAKKSKFTPL
ncbi:MAG: rubredoxin [Bacteroidaceae bacterium]|nr:rubredoxin [Bacteroidaceae bacterium]